MHFLHIELVASLALHHSLHHLLHPPAATHLPLELLEHARGHCALHCLYLRRRRHTIRTTSPPACRSLHLLRGLEPAVFAAGLLRHVRHHAVLAEKLLDLTHGRTAAPRDAGYAPGEPHGFAILAELEERRPVRVELARSHAVGDEDHALHALRTLFVGAL